MITFKNKLKKSLVSVFFHGFALTFKRILIFSNKMPSIPFALQWSIAENELLPLKDSVNGFLQSTAVSNIPDFEYYLRIFPNGNNDEYRGKTMLFLYLELKNIEKVEANRTFTIESANFSSSNTSIFETCFSWGPLICKSEDFFDAEKKYIVDGKCTVKVNGMFKFENDNIPAAIAEQQKWDGGQLGDELWNNDETKDFIIIVDGDKEIKAHKLILGMRSDVFNAMFKSNMKEAIENKMVITDFSFAVVETAVKLIYICNFISSLSLDDLTSLLQFFDKYNLTELKPKVEPFLINQISSSTVCRLANYSILMNSFKLKEKCIEYLMDYFASHTPIDDIDILDLGSC